MTEKFGPEKVKEITSQIFGDIIDIVRKYEGYIERIVGDEVLAIFGYPKSHEDDPIRAIKAAREIHAAVEFRSPQIEKKLGRAISMHTGINTGFVITGEVDVNKGSYGITGDSVNLAARFESLAEPGEILIGENTFRQAEGFFIFEGFDPVKVKGKKDAVKIYRVIAPSTHRTRFDVSSERGLTPFVGRERELKFLMEGFSRAKNGKGQVFSIVSEAGVGKSRLLYEFRKAVAREDVTFLEGKCISYNRGVAFKPIIDIVKSNFDICDDDDDSVVRAKIRNGLAGFTDDLTSVFPYFMELLSAGKSGIEEIFLSPEGKKAHIIEVLKMIAIKGSELRPLILAIEDLHWIDKNTEDTLRELIESIAGSRIFLIFTYRYEYSPKWENKSYCYQIKLVRFEINETNSMIAHLLNTKKIDENLLEFMQKRTDGNPFFIEEFIKYSTDLNIIERRNDYALVNNIQGIMIPSTISDVIMARVDTLPNSTKELLQTGSLIEREFSHALIKKVSGLSEQELLTHLSIMKQAELIYERGIYPKSTYVFKHALTREVVYESILSQNRKKLHRKIAISIESLFKDNLAENYRILTEHYIAAGDCSKGAEYAKKTAKNAEKSAALNDAIIYTEKRIASLEKLPKAESVQRDLIDARVAIGLYYMQYNYHVEAKAAVEPIFDIAIIKSSKKRLSQIYTIMGTYAYMVDEDIPKAIEYLENGLKISELENDDAASFFINHFYGLALSLDCKFDEALTCFEKALKISTKANSQWGVAAMNCMIAYFVHWAHGQIDQGYRISEEALKLSNECGDIFSKALSFTTHGILSYSKSAYKEAMSHLIQGVELCERIDLFFWNALAQTYLGEVCYSIGEYSKAKAHYTQSISLLKDKKIIPYWVKLNKIGLIKAKVMNKEPDISMRHIVALEKGNKMKFCDGLMKRYIGEICLNMEDVHLSDADSWITGAIGTDTKNGMLHNLGLDYVLYSNLCKKRGDQSGVAANQKKALKIFSECGCSGISVC